MRRVAVIGAGPAGLAAAVHALDAGADVEVYEASPHVGGLARTVDLWGHPVDLGSHIFSGGPREAVQLWERFLGPQPHRVPLRRGILRSGVILNHPPQAADLVRKLPLSASFKCGVGALRCRLASLAGGQPSDASAEQWVASRFGQPAYDVLLRDYVEKLWGTSGLTIESDFASSLLAEKSRVDAAVDGAGEGHFLYPRGGTGSVWQRMRAYIEDRGRISLRAPIEKIQIIDGRVTAIRVGGEDRPADYVISSMPLLRLLHAVGAPSGIADTGSLRTRNAMVVQLHVTGGEPLGFTWVYIYDRSLAVGRVVDSRFWQPSADGRGVITMEFWCGSNDSAWLLSDADVIRLAQIELGKTNLLDGATTGEGKVTRLPNALPIPSVQSRTFRQRAEEDLSGIGGLASIGRHGEFAFNSMALSMASGVRAARLAVED
jgi:protoporphyrinogen oxidase